jgi:hypothetical protein
VSFAPAKPHVASVVGRMNGVAGVMARGVEIQAARVAPKKRVRVVNFFTLSVNPLA